MTLIYRPDHPDSNDNGMVEKHLVAPHHVDAVQVISDTMELMRNMVDGKYYDSKSKFREVTRAHGCIEVGNETATLLKPRKPVELDRGQRKEDIRRAIYELRNS
jgi:hypothetical protein